PGGAVRRRPCHPALRQSRRLRGLSPPHPLSVRSSADRGLQPALAPGEGGAGRTSAQDPGEACPDGRSGRAGRRPRHAPCRTSALTSLLQSMGLWAGGEEDFPPADDHNEAGYWEHRGIWSIDEAILQTLGTSWSGSVDLDLSRLAKGARAIFQERARKIV